jgi:predicted acetyltransferase
MRAAIGFSRPLDLEGAFILGLLHPTPVVSVEPAALSDERLLSNLLELYIHDLSDVFLHVELGVDGRFGYPQLSRYWSEPDSRFPFLIRAGDAIAGFVLATRGSAAPEEPDVFDVAEFFVLRRFRRAGVGRRAAFLLWDRLPGEWTVRVATGNAGALEFWRGVVGDYAQAVSESSTTKGPHTWCVFRFHLHGESTSGPRLPGS